MVSRHGFMQHQVDHLPARDPAQIICVGLEIPGARAVGRTLDVVLGVVSLLLLVPRSANVIDAHGRTLMPGLADMHVHLMGGWDGEHVDMLGYAGARSERVGGKLKQLKSAESGESAISICSPTRSAGETQRWRCA